MFRATAKERPQGNYNVPSSCTKGHVVFKKAGDKSTPYKCPYCGHKVH